MKKILTLLVIPLSLLITSCATDIADIVTDDASDNAFIEEPDYSEGIWASLPELVNGNNTPSSRSTLTYDYTTKKMLFSWTEEEKLGALTHLEDLKKSTQQMIYRTSGQALSVINSKFRVSPTVKALVQKMKYIACHPFNAQTKIEAMPMDFTQQVQKANVNMNKYFTYTKKNGDNYKAALPDYLESEKAAASHLGAIDYLASFPITTSEEGGCFFSLQRIGVVTRFYMKCPDNKVDGVNKFNETFEQLQLVTHNAPLFTLKGTADLTSMELDENNKLKIDITPTKTSNAQILNYNSGINMAASGQTGHTADYYYNNVGYIISYMMLAPVDLSGNDVKVYAYLISHDNSDTSKKKYYKSAALSKPNLTSNMFYQWTSANNTSVDEPITFTEVTVEQFKEDTQLNNDHGGTEGW